MATKYIIEGSEPILIQSLTFGYLADIESGVLEENTIDAVVNATNLDNDAVRELRRPDVMAIWDIVKKETYPELYNQDGTSKDFGDIDVEDDKKKD